MSNLSDMSGNTTIPTCRPRLDVACVIDTHQPENLAHRKCALDELKQACSSVNANMQHIQVRVDFVSICFQVYTAIFFSYLHFSLRN